jgi:hypothetical protein
MIASFIVDVAQHCGNEPGVQSQWDTHHFLFGTTTGKWCMSLLEKRRLFAYNTRHGRARCRLRRRARSSREPRDRHPPLPERAPGGRIEIWTPHFSHPNAYHDPTHKHYFTLGTFDYFTGDRAHPKYVSCRFRMVEKRLIFDKHELMGRLLARISARHYEKHYSHNFPPRGLFFELEIIK